MEKTRDITDPVGLAWVLIARNGANEKISARICADTDGKKNEWWDSTTTVPR